MGRLQICRRARNGIARLAGKIIAGERRHHRQCLVGATAAGVSRSGDDRKFDADRGDLYVHPLSNQPLLDGYRDDWGVAADPAALPTSTGYAARILAGSTERYLYLYAEVDDSHFDAEPSNLHPERDRFDRIDLTLEGADGTQASYFFGTNAPGLIAAKASSPVTTAGCAPSKSRGSRPFGCRRPRVITSRPAFP